MSFALCLQAAARQDDAVQLSANLVTVTVVVRDRSGALVRDLGPKDLVVLEDGVQQEIDQFHRQQELPLRLVLLFDTSISVKDRLDFERRAASRFFTEVLRPQDQAALMSVSTEWKLEQPLTSAAAALAAATGRLRADGITSLFGALDDTARYLGTSDGRRVAVILSDGHDTGSRMSARDALASAQLADVVVYGIGSKGRAAEADPATAIGAETLRYLCSETGGTAYFPAIQKDPDREASELDGVYRLLVEELRSQYVLTYYSSAPAHDGGYRRIQVEVRRPGVNVTARKGYFAM